MESHIPYSLYNYYYAPTTFSRFMPSAILTKYVKEYDFICFKHSIGQHQNVIHMLCHCDR